MPSCSNSRTVAPATPVNQRDFTRGLISGGAGASGSLCVRDHAWFMMAHSRSAAAGRTRHPFPAQTFGYRICRDQIAIRRVSAHANRSAVHWRVALSTRCPEFLLPLATNGKVQSSIEPPHRRGHGKERQNCQPAMIGAQFICRVLMNYTF